MLYFNIKNIYIILCALEGAEEDKKSNTLKKKVEEEKKQREHLLELNQILAQQVMEKSKLVAGEDWSLSRLHDRFFCNKFYRVINLFSLLVFVCFYLIWFLFGIVCRFHVCILKSPGLAFYVFGMLMLNLKVCNILF